MSNSAVTVISPPGRSRAPSPGVWGRFMSWLFPNPADPTQQRLEALEVISSRTWLPSPLRQEISRSVTQGRMVQSLRDSASPNIDPWDVERVASGWQTEADGLIHKARFVAVLSGIAEILLFAAFVALTLYVVGDYVFPPGEAVDNRIKKILPHEWRVEERPNLSDMFVATLRLCALAAAATLSMVLAIQLFWSRGPRRWGMVFAISVSAPAIVVFSALSYTMAHQINLYHQSVLEREAAEAHLVELQAQKRQAEAELVVEAERGKALSKDSRAYNMVHAAIMAKNSGAATAALSKLASHFDETERKNANKTERTGLLAALNASIGRLRDELSKLPRPATAQLSEGQGTNPGDPPHHTNGKTAAAEADALAMWARKIDVEIERLIQLRTLLENSSDRELTRAVTQAVLDNVKNAPPDRALIAALAEYVKDLESNAKDAKRVSGDRLRALTEFVGTTVQGQIATAHKDLMTKRQVEMKNLSLVRNSLGDVSDLVIGSSRLAANSGKTNGGQPDGGTVEQNGQKTPQHLIQSFDTILRVIVALALTVLMVACASQVIFVVCVGALVLLLPLFIHWLLSEQRPSRWSGVLKRVILVALAVLALLVAVPFLYGLGSQVAGWAQGLSAGS